MITYSPTFDVTKDNRQKKNNGLGKILAMCLIHKGLKSLIHKKDFQSEKEKMNNPLEKEKTDKTGNSHMGKWK